MRSLTGLLVVLAAVGCRDEQADEARRADAVLADSSASATTSAVTKPSTPTSSAAPRRAPHPQTPPARSSAPVTAEPIPEHPFTIGIVERQDTPPPPAVLKDARVGRHEGFDRIVFEFAERTPGYRVEYVDTPIRKCGSGKVTDVAGEGWLEVRFELANAHTETGKPTVAERERELSLGALRELELTCDFEAIVTWVVGMRGPLPYRVFTLTEPPRIVLDVRHSD